MTSPEDPRPCESLRARIEAWSAEHASDFPPEVLRIFAERTEEVLKSDILSTCVRKGQMAPDFELPDSTGAMVQLADKAGQGPVILSFYRGTWCPYCNLEFQAQLETMPQFRSCGTAVLAVSPQVINRREDPALKGFVDLCDEGNHAARRFGLVYPLGNEIKKIYHRFGIRLEELNGDDSYEVPIPATYIVDQDLVVRYSYTNPDFYERAEPEALLEILTQIGGGLK